MREANAIDFWRGVALLTIFVNHIPGNAFERFTYSRYSISDAAELFVFLAGWSLALATENPRSPDSPRRVILRLASRALEIYRAQLVVMLLAFALIAAAALWLDNPLLLEWHNAGSFFADPVPTTVGVVLLTHQLGYFNILPLYVGLLVLAPVFVLATRVSRWLALGLSFALYAGSLTYQWNLPSWPTEGHWFFNPLAWQFLLVLGFVSSLWSRERPGLMRAARRLWPLALAGVAAAVVVTVLRITPDPYRVPEPALFFLFDKTYVSPIRLLDFAALAVAFGGAYPWIARAAPGFAQGLSGLGRNSLAVFSVGSVLALAIQLVRASLPRSFWLDAGLVGSGILLLLFTVWFVEWRTRSPKPSSLPD